MGQNSSIEWTDHSFNPWIGCFKVSPGCKHCYAETLMDIRYGRVKWGINGTRSRTSDANWKKPLQWNRQAEKEGRRYRVFCASLADVFEDRPELVDWRSALFLLIDATPHLDWLLLTKRPENIRRMWPYKQVGRGRGDNVLHAYRPNVWLGTSVEDQDAANERIPHLLNSKHLARFTFLSCEPLLGGINLDKALLPICPDCKGSASIPVLGGGTPCPNCIAHQGTDVVKLHWVITGGESGPGARPMHPDWPRSLRDQCEAAGVPFLFKQWGEYTSVTPEDFREPTVWVNAAGQTATEAHALADGGAWIGMHKIGKHAAGRILDGIEHNGFPQ